MPGFADLASEHDQTPLERPPAGSLEFVEHWERVRARLAHPVALAALLSVVAVVAGVFWYRAGIRQHTSRVVTASTRRVSVPTTIVRDGGSSDAIDVVVYVSGAVTRPGLYHLANGARIADAVAAAGGPVPDADIDRVNLAARVADGQHVVVPRRGEITADASAAATGAEPAGPVSLNSATVEQLESLPRIGPALARAIVDYRDRHGGFRSVHELRNVRGIGERVYADLVERVTL